MDEGNAIGVIYFDFTKAFDSAKHRFPMTYMKSFDPGDVAVQWIEINLSGRIARVHISGELSGAIPMRSDVPQGSIHVATFRELPLRCPRNTDVALCGGYQNGILQITEHKPSHFS